MPSGPLFVAPASVDDVLGALAEDGSMLVAGGTSVGMMLKNRLIEPSALVFLGEVPGISGVARDEDGSVRIGAMTTLREIIRSPIVLSEAPILAKASSQVGNPRVRSLATIGGGVVHGDPRQDLPPVLLALRARVRVAGASGSRELEMDEMLIGFMETAIDEREIVTEVILPPAARRRSAYARYTPNSEDDYPTVGVAASIRVSGSGTVEDAVVALSGVGMRALVVVGISDLLVGALLDEQVIDRAAAHARDAVQPTDDHRGSSSYKQAMVEVWTRRTLRACAVQ